MQHRRLARWECVPSFSRVYVSDGYPRPELVLYDFRARPRLVLGSLTLNGSSSLVDCHQQILALVDIQDGLVLELYVFSGRFGGSSAICSERCRCA